MRGHRPAHRLEAVARADGYTLEAQVAHDHQRQGKRRVGSGQDPDQADGSAYSRGADGARQRLGAAELDDVVQPSPPVMALTALSQSGVVL